MKYCRSRLLGLAVFALLSLGQAYPFSMAWGMSQKTHLCCCLTERPQPCGCDHGTLKRKKFSCHGHGDDGSPKFAPAPCGKKTQAAGLNFQGETFLPQFVAFRIPLSESPVSAGLRITLPKVLAVPESPPPRPSSLS